jgi:hypothetical protein
VDYCIESYQMSHDDLPVSVVAQPSNRKSKNISNNKNISNSHTKQDMKMAKRPSHAATKNEKALKRKSALRPAKQQQQQQQRQQSLPSDTPVKSKRMARSGSDLSDSFGQQQQPQKHRDDTAKKADYQQTPVTTATDDESVLAHTSLTIEDLKAKIRRVHKLIKMAKLNTAKDQEAARRMVRENEALENELDTDGTNARPSLPGKQTVEGLMAACAKARQKLLSADQAIAKMDARLGQVLAEADVLAKQIGLAEVSMLVDASATDTTSTKVADTTTTSTDDDILAKNVDLDEVSVFVDQFTSDATSFKVADTTTTNTDDEDDDGENEDELAENVDLKEVLMLVDQLTSDTTNSKVTDTTTAATSDEAEDDDSSSNNSSEINIDDDSSSSSSSSGSSSSSESDNEGYQGFVIPQLPVYTPGAE